jgi:hypothetical protein
MKRDIAVVIPVHKEYLSPEEKISLKQVCRILKNRDKFLIVPERISVENYLQLSDELQIIRIPDFWLDSLESYNKYKLSHFFYHQFRKYKFILTYELDSFIFRDDLDYWINLNYDYIGAPWFEGFNTISTEKFFGVGNSGFSLRKTSSIRDALRKYFMESSGSSAIFKFNRNHDKLLFSQEIGFEDWFISNRLKRYLNIATTQDALKFSFEFQPELLYELNNDTLPTGCHAWARYNKKFWIPFINQYGYKLND